MSLRGFLTSFVFLVVFLLWPTNYLLNFDGTKAFKQKVVTIFSEDYQARQQIIRNANLYPNIFLARFFQNKLNIPITKFKNNFFVLADPNYYFFGSHPRELGRSKSLVKLPFVSLIFFLVGFFTLLSKKGYLKLYLSLLFLLTTLSFIMYFETYDLILWPFFCIFIYQGSLILEQKNPNANNLLIVLLFVTTLIEYLKIFAK